MRADTDSTPIEQRAVLDTNVVLALWLFQDPRLNRLRHAVESGHLLWLASEPMLGELWRELRADRCQQYGVSAEAIKAFLVPLPIRVSGAEPATSALIGRLRCTDPMDQMFIDLAVALRVRWLISRDRAVLKLRGKAASLGVNICTPEAWVAAPSSP